MKKITLIVPDFVTQAHGREPSAARTVPVDSDVVRRMLSKRGDYHEEYYFPDAAQLEVNVEDVGQASFRYLLAKAQHYLDVGPEKYREEDAFGMPESESTEEELTLLRLGMEQICAGRGATQELPFEGLGIRGFYLLLETLHFRLEAQAATLQDPDPAERSAGETVVLDTMRMRHVVTGDEIVLFNRVKVPL